MMFRQAWIQAAVLLLLGAVLSACAVAPDRPGRPAGAAALDVSTAPVRVPPGGHARLVLSSAFGDEVRIPVSIVFEDVEGNVLDRREGVVAPGQPLIEALGQRGFASRKVALRRAATSDGTLLQTRISLGPIPADEDDGSCPVHLSLEVDDQDDTDTYHCPGLDPCDGGGIDTQGPGHGSDIFPLCATQPAG